MFMVKYANMHQEQLYASYYIVYGLECNFNATVIKRHFVQHFEGDLMPSDSKFVILEEYVITMKLIAEITEAIGGEK